MPNIATVLKEEISRLARKEVKKQMGPATQALSKCRREITGLKRQVRDQEKRLAFLLNQGRAAPDSRKRRMKLPKGRGSPPARFARNAIDWDSAQPNMPSWWEFRR